jgi:hypothetical protein
MFRTVKRIIPTLFISIVFLSGCVTVNTQRVPLDTARNDECLRLKEQLVLNDATSHLNNQPGINPVRAAQLYKEYEGSNCEAVIAQSRMKKGAKAFPASPQS